MGAKKKKLIPHVQHVLLGREKGRRPLLICWSCMCSMFLLRRLKKCCRMFLLDLPLAGEGFM